MNRVVENEPSRGKSRVAAGSIDWESPDLEQRKGWRRGQMTRGVYLLSLKNHDDDCDD